MRLIFCQFVLFYPLVAFSQYLSPQVLASSGSFYSSAQGSLSFTIGELAEVQTFSSSSIPLVLTQGFQQSDPPGNLALYTIDFNGQREKKVVKLEWKVTGEPEKILYTVWKSGDGQHFRQIGTVMGANRNTDAKYLFRDEQAFESVLFYRLGLEEKDAQPRYSRIICLSDQFELAEVYPNPVSDRLLVSFVSDRVAIKEIRVFSMDGRVVKRVLQNILPGPNTFFIPCRDLPAGSYWLSGITTSLIHIIKI